MRKVNCNRNRTPRALAGGLMGCLLLVLGLLFSAEVASADHGGTSGTACIREAAGFNTGNACTANDVPDLTFKVIGTCSVGGTACIAGKDGGGNNLGCAVCTGSAGGVLDGEVCDPSDLSDPCLSASGTCGLTGGECQGIDSCLAGETITVNVRGTVISQPEKFDLGFWLSETGGNATGYGGICQGGSDEGELCELPGDVASCEGGGGTCDPQTCFRTYLHPIEADNSNVDGFFVPAGGPYWNSEIGLWPDDVCGDINATQTVQGDLILDLICLGGEGDQLVAGTCLSWSVNAQDAACTSELDTDPSQSSKCGCDFVPVGDIVVQRTASLEVRKEVKFADGTSGAPGVFDLEVDGTAEATDQGHGGTTGSLTVSAGTSADPGETHTVSESAGTSTSLDDYDSSISCDNGQSCSDCVTIEVDFNPDDVVVCTITNQLKDPCFGVDCSGLRRSVQRRGLQRSTGACALPIR